MYCWDDEYTSIIQNGIRAKNGWPKSLKVNSTRYKILMKLLT